VKERHKFDFKIEDARVEKTWRQRNSSMALVSLRVSSLFC